MNGIEPLHNFEDIIQTMRYRLQRAHVETKAIINKIKLRNKLNYD